MSQPKTPAMRQFAAAKQQHPDAIVFFRMGDFYELFHDDAKVAAKALGITLTARGKGETAVPMAGVPVRSLDGYLRRLVQIGHRVAICEQMQDPKDAKGVVERAVVRVVTPGTVTDVEVDEIFIVLRGHATLTRGDGTQVELVAGSRVLRAP